MTKIWTTILRVQAAIGQKIHRLDLNAFTEVSMWLYVVPLLLFTAVIDLSQVEWAGVYYSWDKGKDFLFIFILYHTLSESKRKRFYPIVLFTFLRFLWELIATIFDVSVNFPFYVDWAFYALLVFTVTLTIKDLRKHVKKTINGSS